MVSVSYVIVVLRHVSSLTSLRPCLDYSLYGLYVIAVSRHASAYFASTLSLPQIAVISVCPPRLIPRCLAAALRFCPIH
ncbi:hypothetical protein B0H11DRAFT_2052048, partial [Mycena galericulata]